MSKCRECDCGVNGHPSEEPGCIGCADGGLHGFVPKPKQTGWICSEAKKGTCGAKCVITWLPQPLSNKCVYNEDNPGIVWDKFYGKIVE